MLESSNKTCGGWSKKETGNLENRTINNEVLDSRHTLFYFMRLEEFERICLPHKTISFISTNGTLKY